MLCVDVMRNIKVIYIFYFTQFAILGIEGLSWPLELGNNNDTWHGRWFPNSEKAVDNNQLIDYQYNTKHDLYDDRHGIKMGISSICDNGVDNLQQDWLDDPLNYTCYDDKSLYLPRDDQYPVFIADHIPKDYSAQHKCMNTPISYDREIPTFGPHRPLWAKYGEYKFLPKQRWVHNLEHGAIVMLYHPCADVAEVNLLRKVVVDCLYRHIITPFTELTAQRPFALVGWGRQLVLSKVDADLARKFIMKAAQQGPEKLSKDGQYDHALLQHAAIVTTEDDDIVCSDVSQAANRE